MDSFHEEDSFTAQSASALPFNITLEVAGSYPEQISIESRAAEASQPHPGLGGRALYSKEQWEAQRPVIGQLYNVDKKSYKRVIHILRTKHNFFPTRRQFYRKINEWGYQKNIKDKEKRALVQNLNQRRNGGEDLAVELRGQQIDPVKIHRWQKRPGRMDVIRPFSSNPSTTGSFSRISNTTYGCESPMEVSGSSTLDLPKKAAETSRVADDPKSGGFDHWNLVDVSGSPLLKRLFEALEIECESTIPFLDLTSSRLAADLLSTPEAESKSAVDMSDDVNPDERIDFSSGACSEDLVRYSQEVFQSSDTFLTDSNPGLAVLSYPEWCFREWDFSRGQPLKMNISHIFGLSPFPMSSETSRNGTLHYTNLSPYARSQYLQVEETKWKRRLRNSKLLFGTEDLKTLATMDKLAAVFYKQDKFRRAERLYRQITASYNRTLGLKHRDTLSAYLDVIDMLCMQGEWLQANKIHQRIHNTITGVVDQHDQLALRSNTVKTEMLYYYGQFDEADKLIRQTLQIELYILGPRRTDTLLDMRVLARTLSLCGRFAESERLLRINIQLYRELEGAFSENCLESVQFLATELLYQGRYNECRELAITLAERLGTSVGEKHADTLYSLYTVACCLRRQGDLLESERQLRSILEKQIKTLGEEDPDTCDVLRELSGVLVDTGRCSEAVTLLEKSYKGMAKSLGIRHTTTLRCCQDLGDIYEKLGRYEDAIELLQGTADDARAAGEQPSRALLNIISILARLLGKMGRYEEAVSFYEECFDGFVGIYGLSDPSTTYIIESLGWCYEESGGYNDALALYQPSFDQISGIKGNEHPALMEVSEWMRARREILAASTEEVDAEQENAVLRESPNLEEVLTGEGDMGMQGRLAEGDSSSAEEDWMELVDLDLVQNSPPKTFYSDEDTQVDETYWV